MINRIFALAACLAACSPFAFASGILNEQLTLAANGVTATIDVFDDGALTVGCSAFGQCGNFPGRVFSDGPDGEMDIAAASFQGYRITLAALGGADAAAPTLLNLGLAASKKAHGPGFLGVTFTDTDYTKLSATFNLATSLLADTAIASSTAEYDLFSSSSSAFGGGDLLAQTGGTGPAGLNLSNPSYSGSITLGIGLSFTNNGALNANATVAGVATADGGTLAPEPGSFLLGGGLLCLAGAGFLRGKASAPDRG